VYFRREESEAVIRMNIIMFHRKINIMLCNEVIKRRRINIERIERKKIN
jgi:hypothetical protein